MIDEQQGYYGASPTNVEQDFWLEQGKRILPDYITAIRAAAKALSDENIFVVGIFLYPITNLCV